MTPDLVLKALGEPSSGGQPCERFLFHGLTMPTEDPAGLELEIYSRAAAGQIPDTVDFTVITTGPDSATAGTDVFFDVCEALRPGRQGLPDGA